MEEELETVLKKIKTEKLQTSRKYFLKDGRQEILTIYFCDNTMLSINKTQQMNG